MSITCHSSSPVSLFFPKLTIYVAPDVITAVTATAVARVSDSVPVIASHSAILCDLSLYSTVVFHIVHLKSPLAVLHCNTDVTPHTTLSVTVHTSRWIHHSVLNLCALHHSQCSLLFHLNVLHYSLHSDITSDCITHAHNIFMWASTQALHTFTVNPLLGKTLSTFFAFTTHCFIVSRDMSKCLNMHVTIITPHSWLQRYP